jgi:uncharacterized MnhB-related membrane protein
MGHALNITFIVMLVLSALLAVFSRDLLAAVIIFSVYSLIMSLMWQRLQAPDLALTEAAVGAGITTVLFVVAIFKTRRREEEEE